MHCSGTERRADDATRDVVSWLKCEFMSHRVGDVFDGIVSSVASFGLFVDLTGLYIDGLVHVSALGEGNFVFDKASQRLVGKRNGRSFGLGEPIKVQVARVNLEERKIDLVPAAGTGEPADSEPIQRRGQKFHRPKAQASAQRKPQGRGAPSHAGAPPKRSPNRNKKRR